MITKLARKYLESRGFEVRRSSPDLVRGHGYEIVSFRGPDGTLDIERYRKVQNEGNARKLDRVWVREQNIEFLADYLRRTVGSVRFGICHGTRRGLEQQWFRKYLDADVIGTEIADSAAEFPHTIQWDFHEVKPEWEGSADFIYSNSFDHTYDPALCLNRWMSCVRPGGVCIIEHSEMHERATELDPFGASIAVLPYLILEWGGGRFHVREILDAPDRPPELRYLRFLVIEHTASPPTGT